MSYLIKLILVTFSLSFVLIFSSAQPIKNAKPIENILYKRNWINIKFINCLQNNLACECRDSTKGIIAIILDTNIHSDNSGISCLEYGEFDFDLFDIQKKTENHYEVLQKNDDQYVNIAKIYLKGDSLFYVDKKKVTSVFLNYGRIATSENFQLENATDENQYEFESIIQLDKAFLDKGYPKIEKMLSEDSLKYGCNYDLGNLNIISNRKKTWVLERQSNCVFIYEIIYLPGSKTITQSIKKKLIKRIKW